MMMSVCVGYVLLGPLGQLVVGWRVDHFNGGLPAAVAGE